MVRTITAIAVLSIFVAPARADVITYSDLTNFTGQAFSNGNATNQAGNTITNMVADHINFASFGGQLLTQCVFTVSNLNASTVGARPRIRFYDDDGAAGAPGTNFFSVTFNAIGFAANSVNSFNFNPQGVLPGLTSPADGSFWVGITFDNNTGATGATATQLNNLGQGLFDPPTVGTSEDTIFISSTAGVFGSNPPGSVLSSPFSAAPNANFGWQFQAVPEPGSMTLLGIAVAGGLYRIRRKKS